MTGDRTIKRRYPPSQRRRQIVEAARDCIAELGLARATVREIAARCDVSAGTIGYHFPTLDQLLLETLRTASISITDEARMEIQRIPTARERIYWLFDHAFPDKPEAQTHWRLWIEYWGRAMREPALGVLHIDRYKIWRELLAQVIREGIDTGEFATVDEWEVAIKLTAVFDGVAIQVMLHDPAMTGERAWTILRSFVTAYLPPGQAPQGQRAPERTATPA